jgi:hypothetical protein
MPKYDREVSIGKLHLLKASEGINVSGIISDKLREYRFKFIESNNILDNEIVRIAKDAIYVNRSVDVSYTSFDGNIIFRPKMEASSMINLNGVLVFSWYDSHGNINIEVKGLGKNSEYHQNGMLVLIANTMYMVDRTGIVDAIRYIQETYKLYISRQLPIDYYRTFDSISEFRVKNSNLSISNISNLSPDIDIGYNLYIIRELYSIVFNLYVSR